MHITEYQPAGRALDADQINMAKRIQRRNRWYIVATTLPSALAVALWIFTSTWPYMNVAITPNISVPRAALPVAIILLLFVSISAAAVLYVQTGFTRDIRWVTIPTRSERLEETPATNSSLGDQPTGSEKASTAATSMIEIEDDRFRDTTRYGDEMIGRLSDAIDSQGRRNNVNLGFGFFITLVGIGALSYFVQQHHDIDPLKPWMMLNFVPRLSLVILIELFAYFFLNLYKNGLSEVKYLQNELINVRMRTLGLRSALREGDKDSAGHIVRAFGDTDRNVAVGRDMHSTKTPETLLKAMLEATKLANKLASSKD